MRSGLCYLVLAYYTCVNQNIPMRPSSILHLSIATRSPRHGPQFQRFRFARIFLNQSRTITQALASQHDARLSVVIRRLRWIHLNWGLLHCFQSLRLVVTPLVFILTKYPTLLWTCHEIPAISVLSKRKKFLIRSLFSGCSRSWSWLMHHSPGTYGAYLTIQWCMNDRTKTNLSRIGGTALWPRRI